MKNIKGSLFLLVAAMIWGTSFVAQSEVSDNMTAFAFNASRSFVATLFLALVSLITYATKKKDERGKFITKIDLLGGGLCGIFFFLASFFQQQGITLYPEEVASSGRAGFITATYVVMVAVFSLIKEKKMQIPVLLSVLGCISGMYFLCLSGGLTRLYVGDLWVFFCAIGFAVHLILIDRFPKSNPIRMSLVQFFICGVLSFICSLTFDQSPCFFSVDTLGYILYMGVLSSGVAYTLQMMGQKYTSPTVSSIILSLESVFAVLAGWLLISERLSLREGIGCVLVFISVILSQIGGFKSNKQKN